MDQVFTCNFLALPIKVYNLTTYVPGVSRTLPEMKERMGSLCAVGMEDERALGSPMVCGLVRGGLRTPGVGVEPSPSHDGADWAWDLLQEKPEEGDAMLAVKMMLSRRRIASEGLGGHGSYCAWAVAKI